MICGVFLDLSVFSGCYRKKVIDLLYGWRNWFSKHSSNMWNIVLLCLMWALRRDLNHHTFEDTESSVTQLTTFFIRFLFDWLVCGVLPIVTLSLNLKNR